MRTYRTVELDEIEFDVIPDNSIPRVETLKIDSILFTGIAPFQGPAKLDISYFDNITYVVPSHKDGDHIRVSPYFHRGYINIDMVEKFFFKFMI